MALNGHGNLKNNKVNPSIYFDKKDMGYDAPPNSLMDSIASPKGENNESIKNWNTLLSS
jgi:hypothetical protein